MDEAAIDDTLLPCNASWTHTVVVARLSLDCLPL
jgi:hypothetical protein